MTIKIVGAGAIIIKRQKIFTLYHNKFQQLAIPHGKVDAGETPLQAITRELKEEVNITNAEIRHHVSYTMDYGVSGMTPEHLYLVFTDDVPFNKEPEKHAYARFMSKAEIIKSGLPISEGLRRAIELL